MISMQYHLRQVLFDQSPPLLLLFALYLIYLAKVLANDLSRGCVCARLSETVGAPGEARGLWPL